VVAAFETIIKQGQSESGKDLFQTTKRDKRRDKGLNLGGKKDSKKNERRTHWGGAGKKRKKQKGWGKK